MKDKMKGIHNRSIGDIKNKRHEIISGRNMIRNWIIATMPEIKIILRTQLYKETERKLLLIMENEKKWQMECTVFQPQPHNILVGIQGMQDEQFKKDQFKKGGEYLITS